MITKECHRYGPAPEECFWIVCSMPSDCYKELKQYAEEHPDQLILYYDCGTRPGWPVPVPETIFQVYTPSEVDGLILFWKVWQAGNRVWIDSARP